MGFEDAGFPALYFRAADAAAPSLLMEDGLMNTAFLLMAQYGGKAVIPIEEVVSPHASEEAKAWLLPRFGGCTAQATYADFLATHNADVMSRLSEVSQPTLVIGGEDDLSIFWISPNILMRELRPPEKR